MSVKKYVQNKWHKLTGFFRSASLAFMSALLDDIEKSGGRLLQETALAAVKAAEEKGGSGSDKFSAAVTSIVATLTSLGVPFLTHAVNGAIEAAVAQIKVK